jgi:ferredoxin-NADP reductase
MPITDLSQIQNTPSWSSRKTMVECLNLVQETLDVKTFVFQAIDPQLFHFKPGQFVGMQLEIDGQKHNRSYTVASTPTRPHTLELTIKREKGGLVSPWLHDNIRIGSKIELRGPAGRFNCFETESDKVLLISAGSGITPMMSMARFWTDTHPGKDIIFLNWVRAVEDIIFRRELSLLAHKNNKFQLEVCCTQPGLTENWLGRRGRINSTTLSDMVPDLNDRVIFCCGPDGFMQQVKQCLQALDFDMANYHDETFDPGGKKKAKLLSVEPIGSVTVTTSEAAVGPYSLTLKKANKRFIVESDEGLLERLEAEGIDIQFGCRVGNCGSCQVKKISGNVVTQNSAGLSDEEREQGFILTCTTRLRSDVELDL